MSLYEDFSIGFHNLFQSKNLTDVILLLPPSSDVNQQTNIENDQQEEKFHTHRLVLCLRSSVIYQKFFYDVPSEKGQQTTRIINVREILSVPSKKVIEAVLKFMYTDSTDFGPVENLSRIKLIANTLLAARELKLYLLEEKCSIALKDSLAIKLSTNDSSLSSEWFRATLAVLQFSYFIFQTEEYIDHDLSKTCINLFRKVCNSSTKNFLKNRAKLIQAFYNPIEYLIQQKNHRCSSSICSDIIFAISDPEFAIEYAVLSGRADIVSDLIARGIDPDSPTSIGLLPVEFALQLLKFLQMKKDMKKNINLKTILNSFPRDCNASNNINCATESNLLAGLLMNDPSFSISWLLLDDINVIVEQLIIGAGKGKLLELNYRARKIAQINEDSNRESNYHESRQYLSMLNLAAKIGKASHVKALLYAGLDVNGKCQFTGWSALHCASDSGSEDVVTVLIEAGIIPNQQDNSGCTALHLACQKGHIGVVKKLQSLVNVHIPDNNGWTPLHHAAFKGHHDIVNLLLKNAKQPIDLLLNTDYDHGASVLHLAASNVHYHVVLTILDFLRGLDNSSIESNFIKTSVYQNPNNISPLNYLSLIVNATDHNGCTPFHMAVSTISEASTKKKDQEFISNACLLIESLIDVESDVEIPTTLGYLPIHFLLGGLHHHDLLNRLNRKSLGTLSNQPSEESLKLEKELYKNISIEKTNHTFIRNILEMILNTPNGNKTIFSRGKDGITPLHCAVRYKFVNAVSLLVEKGADINALDYFGASPLSLAREKWPVSLIISAIINFLPFPPSKVPNSFEFCQSCNTSWSLTKRKHHCRMCNGIFCALCTSYRISIPKFNLLFPVRVCSICHEALSWPLVVSNNQEESNENSYLPTLTESALKLSNHKSNQDESFEDSNKGFDEDIIEND